MVAMRPREIVMINCKNSDNEAKSFSFYEQLMVLKKNLLKTMLPIVA